MDLTRDILLLTIATILLIGVTPIGQNILPTDGTTEKGILNNIDKRTAGIDSDTDGISNLLTLNRFDNEDFAQENTLSNVDSNTDKLEQYTSGTETNTRNLQELIENIEILAGQDGRTTDSFGTWVTKNTQNLLNLPAHNPYNRERWRVKVDNDYKNLAYNTITQYTKKTDHHELTPGQGQTVTLESTESPPYVVHYELWYSWAFNSNRNLETGDYVKWGAFTDENGYYFKKNSTGNQYDAYIEVLRNGTVTKSKQVSLKRPLTDFTRYELRSNWYNAGEQSWVQTITNSSATDVQKQYVIGKTAPNGVYTDGPETPQLPVRFQVHRGGSSSPITLNAGSANVLVAGDVNIISRVKTDYFDAEVSQAGLWEPVAAVRIRPENSFIRSEMTGVDLAETGSNTDYHVSAQQMDPRLVETDTGQSFADAPSSIWSTPAEFSEQNSNLQFTTNVSAAPNSTGSPVSSTSDFGGFQVGWGSLYSSGNKGSASSTAQQGRKRPIYGSDVVVFWAKAEDEGNPTIPAPLTVEYVVEMDY